MSMRSFASGGATGCGGPIVSRTPGSWVTAPSRGRTPGLRRYAGPAGSSRDRPVPARSGRCAGRYAGRSGGLVVDLLDRGDLELQGDALGDQQAAGVERDVPLEAEVAPVDPAAALETGADEAVVVGVDAEQLERDDHLAGDVADGQVAGDHVRVVLDLLHVGAREGDLRPLLHVEEVP